MTMIYDKENLADDERNSKMSELAQSNYLMSCALSEILLQCEFIELINCETNIEILLKDFAREISKKAKTSLNTV